MKNRYTHKNNKTNKTNKINNKQRKTQTKYHHKKRHNKKTHKKEKKRGGYNKLFGCKYEGKIYTDDDTIMSVDPAEWQKVYHHCCPPTKNFLGFMTKNNASFCKKIDKEYKELREADKSEHEQRLTDDNFYDISDEPRNAIISR